MSEFETSRRNLFYGLAAGAAVPVIAACGSSTETTAPSGAGATPGGSGSTGGGTGTPAGGGIATSDVPVGGGAIFPDEGFVVTQPTEGNFKAFSVTCTHSGCPVDRVDDGLIQCPCHGSKFSIEDGSVQDGPARGPLPEKSVTLSGTSLRIT